MSSRVRGRRVAGDQRRVDNIPQNPPSKNLQTAFGQFRGQAALGSNSGAIAPAAPAGRYPAKLHLEAFQGLPPLPLPSVATPAGSACTHLFFRRTWTSVCRQKAGVSKGPRPSGPLGRQCLHQFQRLTPLYCQTNLHTWGEATPPGGVSRRRGRDSTTVRSRPESGDRADCALI